LSSNVVLVIHIIRFNLTLMCFFLKKVTLVNVHWMKLLLEGSIVEYYGGFQYNLYRK